MQSPRAIYFGDAGSTNRYYWVVPNFPTGAGPRSGSAHVVTKSVLDSSNKVHLVWPAVPGAISYAVLRTTTTTAPKTGNVYLATVDNASFTDDGSLTPGAYDLATAQAPTQVFIVKGIYDGTVDSKVVGAVTPSATAEIPNGALVFISLIRVLVAVTSADTATVSIGTTAGSSDVSILAATSKDDLTSGANIVGAAGAAPFVMTAEGSLKFTLASHDLTAGKIEVIAVCVMP